MFRIEIGGKSVQPENVADELMKSVTAGVLDELHSRLACVRQPETGEFPVVVAMGDTLDSTYIRAEGSAELLSLIRERFGEEDLQHVHLLDTARTLPVKVFLSYAWEDHVLAEKVARALMSRGVDVWWAEWEIQAGDSLRQKIDQGVSGCTHFVVLLTPISAMKPWVNEEIDAGFVRKLQAKARFIALRSGLQPCDLPPLLQGSLSPSVDNFEADMHRLACDIQSVSRKPALGESPIVSVPQTGYSPAASLVAKLFVEGSKAACFTDPSFQFEELVDRTKLAQEDVEDALFELQAFIENDRWHITAREELFVTFDAAFMPWDPAKDALRIAADMMNDADFPTEPALIGDRYGWAPRRLNPAFSYLVNRRLAETMTSLGMGDWVVAQITKNDATRRFVKSRA